MEAGAEVSAPQAGHEIGWLVVVSVSIGLVLLLDSRDCWLSEYQRKQGFLPAYL